jgi:hypothetical protein
MSPALRFVLAAFASFPFASSALGYQLSAETWANSTVPGAQVLYSSSSGSLGPPGATSVNVVDGGPACPLPPCITFWTGHGEAYADLATGKLGIYVSGFHGDSDVYDFVSQASFTDTLVFHLPPGMASAQVTLSMSIEADLPQQNLNGRVTGSAMVGLGLDASYLDLQAAAGSRPSHLSTVLPVTTTVMDGLPVDVTADFRAALLLVQTDHGTYTLDALHTASLSISVPAGVTYDSGSRAFLTQVDEPSLVQLLGSCGLGVFAAARRRMRL